MAVQELIPSLRELSRSQKREVMQFLMRELGIGGGDSFGSGSNL